MPNIAILIDAENILPLHADQIFSYANSLGTVTAKEIFGASQALTTWVEPVLKYAIHPNLTIRASKGKNSSDIALVIGAMDLLLAGGIDSVIIASSDSDFSALSVRLRNAGIEVIGMGAEKANPLWRTSCSSFELLVQPAQKSAKPATKPARPARQPQQQPAPAPEPKPKAEEKPAVAGTHGERTAIIKAFIQAEIEKADGKLQTNMLFTALNNLPEYKLDQQRSKRRPLNYLMRQYGEFFAFEGGSDGYVALRGTSSEPAGDAPAEASPEETFSEPEAFEAPESPEKPIDEIEEPDAVDPLALIMDAGVPEDVARKIVQVFTESENLRSAYNNLRKVFGNTDGRNYYQLVKEIAERVNG